MIIDNNIWVLLASGPSLTQQDVNYCIGKAHIAAVNNAIFTCPQYVEIAHAADHTWWDKYYVKVFNHCHKAEFWTYSETIIKRFNGRIKRLNIIPGSRKKPSWGFSTKPEWIYANMLSGTQLPQIVGWKKPEKIILLGYDMKYAGDGRRHFHEDHPDGWNNVPYIETNPHFMQAFDKMVEQCPFEIINCSRDTAIKSLPRANLEDVL